LWACEQALRCADIAAVLAWLPQARVGDLRRLQLAAAQHEGLLFVFRPESVAQSASPARLRLQVMSAEAGQVESATFRSFESFGFASEAYLTVSLAITGLATWYHHRFPVRTI
jgi:hypothetical protein